KKYNRDIKEITPEAMHVLQRHPWPGNIRELENLIARMTAVMDPKEQEIRKGDIPLEYYHPVLTDRSPAGLKLDDAMVSYERSVIIKALRQNNWNRKKTAQALGISYGILKYKVRRLEINIPGSSVRRLHGKMEDIEQGTTQ